MSRYEKVSGLNLEVDAVRLQRHEMDVSSGFTRVTTEVLLAGGGHIGHGEDVTYDSVDQDRLQESATQSHTTSRRFARAKASRSVAAGSRTPRAKTSPIASTASALATSPPRWPPMPSAVTSRR